MEVQAALQYTNSLSFGCTPRSTIARLYVFQLTSPETTPPHTSLTFNLSSDPRHKERTDSIRQEELSVNEVFSAFTVTCPSTDASSLYMHLAQTKYSQCCKRFEIENTYSTVTEHATCIAVSPAGLD
jgi:hypothetical protein